MGKETSFSSLYIQQAKEKGVEFEPRPVDRVVITGYSQITPLGGTEETWNNLLAGVSGVREIEVYNDRTKIGAPLPPDYDPVKLLFPQDDKRGLSQLAAISILLARESLKKAGLLSGNERVLQEHFDPTRVAGWIGSGIAATGYLIDVHDTIQTKGPRRINPDLALRVFPEEINGRTAIAVGFSGWGGNTAEACATGAANITEGYRLIKNGLADVVIAGGVENVLDTHPNEVIGLFTALRALSTRNHEPQKASRPFDKERDGFVPGSGGALVVLESIEHAVKRGARIYAEVHGASKSMDGALAEQDDEPKTTEMYPPNAALTMAKALYDKTSGELLRPDAIFAHATSTKAGEINEAKALRLLFGQELPNIPITAIKSMIGHLLGGAGSVNIVTALQALHDGKIPQILNLENPDEAFEDLHLVRNQYLTVPLETVLTVAYGFGRYNAAVTLKKYQP